MRKFLLIAVVCVSTFFMENISAQNKVKWISFEQAVQLSQKQKKKILIDVYTDWCSWCKFMDRNTYTNEEVVNYINEHFYAVKFNAEQKEDITFKGKVYHFVKTSRNGYHELAAELLKGQLGFPSTVFLDESQSVLQSIQGYKDPLSFEMIITYFGENLYKSTPWSKFERDFQAQKKTPSVTEKPKQLNIKGQ
jgi:thioredoxin-related protein